MQYFNSEENSNTHRGTFTIVLSISLHLLVFLALLLFPVFQKDNSTPLDFVDVTLLDMSGLDGDILPAGQEEEPEKIKDKPKPKKKEELVDPSKAEIARMKKRKKTPKPRKEDSNSFEMKSGFLPGGTGKAQGSLMLDTKQFPFLYYLSMMKNRISENWIPPFGSVKADESKRVVIRFRVQRNGRVISPEIEQSSGDSLLDQSALRAVIVSSPFPPLPDGYNESTLGVHFGFKCQL